MTQRVLSTPPEGGGLDTLDGFLRNVLQRQASRGHLVHIEAIPTRSPRFAEPDPPLPDLIQQALRGAGIDRLYTHQVEALAHARTGKDVLVVTGTASGKSLAYQLPVLETLLERSEARALFLFPTKALEQDQLK